MSVSLHWRGALVVGVLLVPSLTLSQESAPPRYESPARGIAGPQRSVLGPLPGSAFSPAYGIAGPQRQVSPLHLAQQPLVRRGAEAIVGPAAALATVATPAPMTPVEMTPTPRESLPMDAAPMSPSAPLQPADPMPGAGPAVDPMTAASVAPAAPEHPLVPAIRWAQDAHKNLSNVDDYTCTFVKREVVQGTLSEHQYVQLKVRHRPFSVYLNFLAPAAVKGREAIYIEGQNDGNILAHTTGIKHTLVGMLTLRPDSALAMQGNRHPITQIGLLNLTQRLAKTSQRSLPIGETQVQYFPGAKINGRVCTCMQFTNPVPRPEFTNHITRVFVDNELNLPIRYEAYDWPTDPKAAPQLVEEYTYLELKFNTGLADLDFDAANPAYKFK